MIKARKRRIELMRMLDGGDNLRVQIGSNNIRAHVGDFIFTETWWMSLPGLPSRSAEEPDKNRSWL